MLGPRIAMLRREAGFSQAELARRVRVSPSAMGMYEQGRREPAVQTLVALARELGVSTDYLLTGEAASPAEQETLARVLEKRLDAADRRLARRQDRPFAPGELAALFAALLTE